jgi:hypothetical protein
MMVISLEDLMYIPESMEPLSRFSCRFSSSYLGDITEL